MIKQILHLIWNTKRKNTLLFIEILISFLVLFGVYSFLAYGLSNYSSDLGFPKNNVYNIALPFDRDLDSTTHVLITQQLYQEINAMEEVEYVSFSNFVVPFTNSGWSGNVYFEDKQHDTYFANADKEYDDVYKLNITAGRWFDESDDLSGKHPIVINQLLADNILEEQSLIGQTISQGDNEYENTIVGVVDHFKYQGDYNEEQPIFIMYTPILSMDENYLSVAVNPGTPANFELKLSNIIEKTGHLSGFRIKHIAKERTVVNQFFKIPMYIFLFLCVFLILNVALGLIGVVWHNINRRIPEIGLRQAVGAPKSLINLQFIGEQLAIAIMSIFVGTLIAAQFPLLNVFELDTMIYVTGIVLSTVTILLIIVLCTYIPSRKASNINPAIALHEE